MKRYAFLTIIFLGMVVAILLSSCAPAAPITPVAALQPPVSTTQAAALPEQPAAKPPEPTAAPTSAPVQVIPVTAPTQAPSTIAAVVTADVLNMRVGPGMNHRIMAKLAANQTVSVEGRSLTGEWVAVRLADGSEGWVYSSYLSPSADLASLPVMEAYGGPVTSSPEPQPTSKPSGRYKLNVSISDNQAAVTMANFATNRDVTLRLVVPGQDLAMTVASTTTDGQGSANLTFDMPYSWPDGSAVTQSVMQLQVVGSDGKLLGKATITYQSGG